VFVEEQAGGQDTGVVDHHDVAGAQELREVTDVAVLGGRLRGQGDQQARRVPGLHRRLGDSRVGEVVVGHQHPFDATH
jgi:hypothetical protein